MAVSKKVRFEVFKRDLFTCQYCGKRPPDVVLEVDHVHPRCDGGSDEPDNLTTSCYGCNRGKGANGLGKVAPSVDEIARLEAIQEMAERSRVLLTQQRVAGDLESALNDASVTVQNWWFEAFNWNDDFILACEGRSMLMFLRRGLPLSEMQQAIDATVGKQAQKHMSPSAAWRYFCGICWGKIREREGE